MADADWPVGVPSVFEVSGYTEQYVDNKASAPVDIGMPIERRRFPGLLVQMSGTITMTQAQWDTFSTFYNNTLQSGTLFFNYTAPDSGSATEYDTKITQAPQRMAQGNGIYKVQLQMMQKR